MDIVEAPVPLPSAPAVKLADNITLQPPLSRRGNGPGLIILVPEFNISPEEASKTLDPLPLQKWAEEGYAVVEIKCSALGTWDFAQALNKSLESLHALAECDEKEKFGFIDYTTSSDSQVSQSVASSPKIVCAVSYGAFQAQSKQHALLHLTGQNEVNVENRELYTSYQYPEAKSASFIIPGHKDFSPSLSVVAHTRTLTFLKKHIGGPIFDLEAIWNEHTAFEFENRSVANTMGTMVQEPYVNHIPTMTGGIGRTKLSDFYRRHFIFNNPDDTSLELVSRTIGVDRVIDEFIMNFTHETVIDWLVPGIPPTGKKVRVAMTSVVNVRGDRLYHEHIAWDQASVLVQLGLMPEYLPYPYPLPDGRTPAPGKKFEYRVPAAGVETAMKLVDENSVPSNGMFEFQVREVDI